MRPDDHTAPERARACGALAENRENRIQPA
jgi:hypothetical protein